MLQTLKTSFAAAEINCLNLYLTSNIVLLLWKILGGNEYEYIVNINSSIKRSSGASTTNGIKKKQQRKKPPEWA